MLHLLDGQVRYLAGEVYPLTIAFFSAGQMMASGLIGWRACDPLSVSRGDFPARRSTPKR